MNGNDWYSFIPNTTNDRLGATNFKNTFITVGEGGEIWQSDVINRAQDFFQLRWPGAVVWDGQRSEVRHAFLSVPDQTRIMEYSTDLAGPWQILNGVDTGRLGLFETSIWQDGDQRATWGKRMFFRLRK